jgi:hypothetical protein
MSLIIYLSTHMNYNLTEVKPSPIEYNLDIAMPFGDMPSDMMMAKFEETDMGGDEDLYNNYARTTLTDMRPDPASFAHEGPRGAVNSRSAKLQLQYYGHRGNADDPAHPELFLGFGGPEDRDPRGINTEPDMRELRKQEEARMRFVRFTKDDSAHITGGGRSMGRALADQQTLFKDMKGRLRIFDRMLDGRREGMRREYAHKSDVSKQVNVKSYGDVIKDYALNPQRRANIICKRILRDTAEWRCETYDQDFKIAQYATAYKQAHRQDPGPILALSGPDGALATSDTTPSYKAVGVLMADIVKGKRQANEMMKSSEMDFAKAQETMARKTAALSDIALVMGASKMGGDFAVSDTTMLRKTPGLPDQAIPAELSIVNHMTPAHHYLNAEIIYKSVRGGDDLRKIKDLTCRDSRAGNLQDISTDCYKSAKMQLKTGARLERTDDASYEDSTCAVTNYKKVIARLRSKVEGADHDIAHESDLTQNRKAQHGQIGVQDVAQVDQGDISFANNASKERLGGHLGSKYLTRYIDRDGRIPDF